jgi:hypothetical protein
VLGLEPLATLPRDEIVAIAPNPQQYLVGRL